MMTMFDYKISKDCIELAYKMDHEFGEAEACLKIKLIDLLRKFAEDSENKIDDAVVEGIAMLFDSIEKKEAEGE